MSEQPITEVHIDTPGPSITVKAAGDLETVAAKAWELFEKAHAIDSKTKPGPGTGFHTEREWQ